MAEEIKNETDKNEGKTTEEINIENMLQKYDVYGTKNKITGNENWEFKEKNKTDFVEEIDMDYYWNFKGSMSPRVETEFFVKNTKTSLGEWVNINKINKTTANNNYFVSANIVDNGIRKLNLVLYDRNFTDIQKLLGNAIQFANENMSKSDENVSEEETYNMNINSEESIEMFVNSQINFTNLRIRYGYNEDTTSRVPRGYIGVGEWLEGDISKPRWRDSASEKSISHDDKSKNTDKRDISTEETLTNTYQQTTILSPWEEFFITGLTTTLTNTGIKYNIQAVSIDDFALNGYKMYQQYSKITGKPKTVIAALMKKFNEEDSNNNNSPIKLVWADENIRAESSTINGVEILYDYENAEYVKVDEDVKKDFKKENEEPLKNLNEYIELINNIKSCFTNKVDCTISSYVYGLDIQRDENIYDIEREITDGKRLDDIEIKPESKSFMDAVLYPFEINKRLESGNYYGSSVLDMAIYQDEVSKSYSFLKEKNIVKKAGKNEKITSSELIKSWLGMIAINAYGVNAESSTSIKFKNLKTTDSNFLEAEAMLKDACLKIEEIVLKCNNNLPIRWTIPIPSIINDNIYQSLNNYNYYKVEDAKERIIDDNSTSIYDDTPKEFIMHFGNFDLKKMDYFYNRNNKDLINCKNILFNHHIANIELLSTNGENSNFNLQVAGIYDNKIALETLELFLRKQDKNETGTILYALKMLCNNGPRDINVNDLENLKENLIQYIAFDIKQFLKIYQMDKTIKIKDGFYDTDTDGPITVKITTSSAVSANVPANIEIMNKDKKVIAIFEVKYNSIKGIEEDFKKNIIRLIRNIISFKKSISESKTEFKFYNSSEETEAPDYLSTKISKSKDNYNFLKEYNDYYGPEKIEEAKNSYNNYLETIKKYINDEYDKEKIVEKANKYHECYISREAAIDSIKDEKSGFNDVLYSFMEDVEKQKENVSSIRTFKIGKGGETESFGSFDNENKYHLSYYKNLLDAAFSIVSNKSSVIKTNVENLIEDLNTKIKYLNEKREVMIKEQEKLDKSNIGKEIELSLGSQESRNTKLKLTKTLSSLLNDLCSQCAPKVGDEENIKKDGKTTIYDESGNSKIVNIYDNIPRYNLTWGIIGHYKNKEKEIPIVGLYYKQPNKIKKIRKYDWGTGNSHQHCIKGLNISISSEYALINNMNTMTKTSSGNNITLIEKNEVKKIDNVAVPKVCYFSQVFESTRDENIFNNLNNSLNKGTLTLLGDPSLKFSGMIQPYTYPIHLNIKLAKERVKNWSYKDSTIPEDEISPISQLSGYYVVTSITHDISNSGYITTLEIMKYPGTDKLYR